MDRGCSSLAAQTKRWAEGIRVPGPLAEGGSTTARGCWQGTHNPAKAKAGPWLLPTCKEQLWRERAWAPAPVCGGGEAQD